MYITATDIQRLEAELPDRYRALLHIIAYCGLRSGEAYALRRSSINMLRQEIRVTESVTLVRGRPVFGSTKTHKARTVALPEAVKEALTYHLDTWTDAEPDALVFTSTTGTTIDANNFRRNVWKPAVEAAGLPEKLRIHDMRHTAVSLLANAGIPITSVKDHVGHSTITTTIDRYAHLYPETRTQIAGTLDGLIADAASENGHIPDISKSDRQATQ